MSDYGQDFVYEGRTLCLRAGLCVLVQDFMSEGRTLCLRAELYV